jgi:predicted ester cyclase
MAEMNVRVLERLYRDVRNGDRPEPVEEPVADGYVIHDREVIGRIRGPALSEQFADMTREVFPGVTFTIGAPFAADERVVVRWTMTAIHEGELCGVPGPGTVVELEAVEINRFEDGTRAETWTPSDRLGPMEQAGASSGAE